MADVRYRTTRQNIAAGAQAQFALATPDDNVRRKLTGIMVGILTTGIEVFVLVAGYEAARIDLAALSPAGGFAPLDVSYDPGIQITVGLNNTTGGAANNTAIVVRYEKSPGA